MQEDSPRSPRLTPLSGAFIAVSLLTVVALVASMAIWFAHSDHRRPGTMTSQTSQTSHFDPFPHSVTAQTAERTYRDVGIQMFQWPWNAIADECRTTLGRMGIRRVLISPPHENLNIPTWTSSYAPVSYKLDSKLGTRAELSRMIKVCGEQGVDIIADAVMNHMSPVIPPYRGIAGTPIEQYNYPGIYTREDFHHCTLTSDGVMHSYQDRGQVQQCDALGLPDLDTGSPNVQKVLHTYLRDLLSLGVAGFRIDAAKHISAKDVDGIVSVVPEDKYVVQEVILGINEPIHPQEYLGNGRVFDFAFAGVVNHALKYGDLAALFSAGKERGLMPLTHASPIITNHDFERDVNLLNYRDGWKYQFANLLMLATNRGAPFLYSGYAFSERDQPAPSSSDGKVLPPVCAPTIVQPSVGQFFCPQREQAFKTMVEWRYRAMSGELLPRERHTSDIPVLAPAQIVWQQPGVVALMRNGLLLVANWSGKPVQIPVAPGQTDTSSLRSLHAGKVELKNSRLTVQQGDIVVSMRRAG